MIFLRHLRHQVTVLLNQVTVPATLVPVMIVLVAAAIVPAIQAQAVTVLTVPAAIAVPAAMIDK